MGRVRPRHFRILFQYGAAEGVLLFIAVQLNKLAGRLNALVRRWAFFYESRKVFEHAIDHAISFRKVGRSNIFALHDPEIGKCEVTLRRATSDFAVFDQCLLSKQYGAIVQLIGQSPAGRPIRTILDGGANIGLTTVYFARCFPDARVIAVEPENHNYVACCRNVQANALRNVEVVRAALWKANEPVQVSSDFRDGRAWAFHVSAHEGESELGTVDGVRIGTLASRFGIESFDLLKLDIEGAEKPVLLEDVEAVEWVRRARFVALEIHDDDGRQRLIPLLESCGFVVKTEGELTLGIRLDMLPPGDFHAPTTGSCSVATR
jgi:FkbM family methyltransferase